MHCGRWAFPEKKTFVATEQDPAQVAAFVETLKDIPAEKLHFVDETGCDVGMCREYARAPQGQRVRAEKIRNRGTRQTLVAALSLQHGLEAAFTYQGGTPIGKFEFFVEDILLPCLKPGDVVIWDNLAAHHSIEVIELVEAVGATVIFLPPYTPQLNPIEMAFSKIKKILRDAKTTDRQQLIRAIQDAIESISLEDADGWFTACGYVDPR